MNPTIRQQYGQARQTELLREAAQARHAAEARLAAQARHASSSKDETRPLVGTPATQPSSASLISRRLSSAFARLRPAASH